MRNLQVHSIEFTESGAIHSITFSDNEVVTPSQIADFVNEYLDARFPKVTVVNKPMSEALYGANRGLIEMMFGDTTVDGQGAEIAWKS